MSTSWRLLFVLGALALSGHSQATADLIADVTAGGSGQITPEYFGAIFHRLVLRPGERAVPTTWPELDFGAVRLWDSTLRWADIEPAPGSWRFDRFDAYVAAAASHHASVLYTLGSPPQWASSRPDEACPYGKGCSAEPKHLEDWDDYVRHVAQRYGKDIQAYELWNEPYFSDFDSDRGKRTFFSGSSADMLELARHARRVLDEVSPGAVLTSPGFLGGGQRHLEKFLASGGQKYVQVIAYHFWTSSVEQMAKTISDVRSIMRRYGVQDMPLWCSEAGVESYPAGTPLPPGVREHLTNAEAGARAVEYLVLGAAAGLRRYYYFAWDNDLSGAVTRDGHQLQSYAAFAQVQRWLIGTRLTGCRSHGDGVVSCSGEGRDPYLIAWSDHPLNIPLPVPVGWHVSAAEPLYPEQPVPSVEPAEGFARVTLGSTPIRLLLSKDDK